LDGDDHQEESSPQYRGANRSTTKQEQSSQVRHILGKGVEDLLDYLNLTVLRVVPLEERQKIVV
jgi:hypothetical protein